MCCKNKKQHYLGVLFGNSAVLCKHRHYVRVEVESSEKKSIGCFNLPLLKANLSKLETRKSGIEGDYCCHESHCPVDIAPHASNEDVWPEKDGLVEIVKGVIFFLQIWNI